MFAINSISFPIIRGVVEFFRANPIIMGAILYLGKPKNIFLNLHNFSITFCYYTNKKTPPGGIALLKIVYITQLGK